MKKWVICGMAMAFVAVSAAWGQQNEAGAVRHAPRTPMGRGNWVGKRMMTPEFLEKIGVTGEQAANLRKQLETLDKQAQQVEEEITKAAMEQAEIAKKVLAEPGADTEEMMQLVEKIGRMRTEQAKLATRRLIIMRDNLTAEQRQKATAFLNDEQKKWREERETREKNGGARPGNQPNRPPAPKGW